MKKYAILSALLLTAGLTAFAARQTLPAAAETLSATEVSVQKGDVTLGAIQCSGTWMYLVAYVEGEGDYAYVSNARLQDVNGIDKGTAYVTDYRIETSGEIKRLTAVFSYRTNSGGGSGTYTAIIPLGPEPILP